MSAFGGSNQFPDILEDVEEDEEDDAGDGSPTDANTSGRKQFQLQIVVTPLRSRDGGAEITVSGGMHHHHHHPRTTPPDTGKNIGYTANRKLPPIYNSPDYIGLGGNCSAYVSRSRHRNCYRGRLDPIHDTSRTKRVPCRTGMQRSPISKHEIGSHSAASMPPVEITETMVAKYLRSHKSFLERFVMEEVELEQMERWIIRKTKQRKTKQGSSKASRKISLSKWKFCVHADKRKMLQDLTYGLQNNPNKTRVLWEVANCISSAVNADTFRLYIPDGNDLVVYHNNEEDNNGNYGQILPDVAEYVWLTKETVRISADTNDDRFPEGLLSQSQMFHVLCQPVSQANGEYVAVLELYRSQTGEQFHEEDEEISLSYLVWGSIALHYAQLFYNMNQQRKLNDFLLTVVKSIFQDIVSIETLVVKIIHFAQELVDADRASLFLVDEQTKELYATIFDVKLDAATDRRKNEESVKNAKEIRFPLGKGIAGQVARTGEILNISDAYSDPRFNRNVDQITGYKTNTILCMPIFKEKRSVLGVVQMVNKRTGHFTKADEEAFETFAVYCGLALHHADLYDKIQKSEQKYRVALDVLSYHNTCTEEEFRQAAKAAAASDMMGVDDYYFNPFQLDDFDKARHAVYMFIDLFGLQQFDRDSLIRFTLTVKKNYRRVPYHNWTHGFSVANTMYAIIKHSKTVFKQNESIALFIGALCHDLDHRGKNNKFMLDTASPLANIYSTSTMEHHHFNQTVTILQQDGHNIFSKLTNFDYKEVLHLLKHCILATDLALFFPNKDRLNQLIQTNEFSPTSAEHRLLLQALAMTSSDLSASAKPWEIQVRTVEIIFQEFYEQGDAERAAGRTPIPMMDRNQPDQQPASQVGFLTGICTPCYSLLYRLIPETKALLDMCQTNLKKWREIDEKLKNNDT